MPPLTGPNTPRVDDLAAFGLDPAAQLRQAGLDPDDVTWLAAAVELAEAYHLAQPATGPEYDPCWDRVKAAAAVYRTARLT